MGEYIGPKRIGRRGLIAGTGGLLAMPLFAHAQGQNGVALVIGNSKYQWEASLPNVKRDARDIARALQALGLKTELLQDAGRDAMLVALEKFKASSRGATLSAFYYAGHGTSWENETYLIPSDSTLGTPGEVKGLVPVWLISAAMKEAAHRLLVFDSCRDSPAGGWLQRKALGMSHVDTSEEMATEMRQPETLTLFSSAPGRVALDGPPGENSPFTPALIRQIEGEKIDFQTLPSKLRHDLLIATSCQQLVWDQNTYTGAFAIDGARSHTAAERPGAAGGPSGTMELPGIYAYARENGLILPAGLVALLPAAGAPHADKVGSYKFELSVRLSASPMAPTAYRPAAIVVLSVSDDGSAEVVVASKGANNGQGVRWRFLTCPLSGNRLEYRSVDERDVIRLDWRDRNSGLVGQADSQGKNPQKYYSRDFTRLDG